MYVESHSVVISQEEVDMGIVIPWLRPEERPARAHPSTDGERGRILLFLGIRYERHDDATPTPGAQNGNRRGGPESRARARRRG